MKTIDVVLMQVLIKRTEFTSYTRYNDFTINKTFYAWKHNFWMSSKPFNLCSSASSFRHFYSLLIITVTITSL